MPVYTVAFSIDLVTTAIFVDTNVWVSAFDQSDDFHEQANNYIENAPGVILVPISVIVETWGMLLHQKDHIAKNIRWQNGIAFLAWLADPGHNVRLVPELNQSANYVLTTTGSLHVDCVDAMLAHLSHTVNEQCQFQPHLIVATNDARDFPRVRRELSLRFRIWNVASEYFEE